MHPSSNPVARALAFALILAPARSQAQQAFQGVVTYDMTSQGQTLHMTHYMKDGNLRVEFETQGRTMVMLTSPDGSKQIMLMPESKQWVDMKVMQERMAAMMGRMGRGAPAAPAPARGPVEFRATGQSETVAGIRCDHYLVVSENGESDVCAAKGLGWHTDSPPNMGAPAAGRAGGRASAAGPAAEPPSGLSALEVALLRQRFADGFFPLKITSTSNGRSVTIQVVELSKKALEDGLFQPPADYQEMRMPGGTR